MNQNTNPAFQTGVLCLVVPMRPGGLQLIASADVPALSLIFFYSWSTEDVGVIKINRNGETDKSSSWDCGAPRGWKGFYAKAGWGPASALTPQGLVGLHKTQTTRKSVWAKELRGWCVLGLVICLLNIKLEVTLEQWNKPIIHSVDIASRSPHPRHLLGTWNASVQETGKEPVFVTNQTEGGLFWD